MVQVVRLRYQNRVCWHWFCLAAVCWARPAHRWYLSPRYRENNHKSQTEKAKRDHFTLGANSTVGREADGRNVAAAVTPRGLPAPGRPPRAPVGRSGRPKISEARSPAVGWFGARPGAPPRLTGRRAARPGGWMLRDMAPVMV